MKHAAVVISVEQEKPTLIPLDEEVSFLFLLSPDDYIIIHVERKVAER